MKEISNAKRSARRLKTGTDRYMSGLKFGGGVRTPDGKALAITMMIRVWQRQLLWVVDETGEDEFTRLSACSQDTLGGFLARSSSRFACRTPIKWASPTGAAGVQRVDVNKFRATLPG